MIAILLSLYGNASFLPDLLKTFSQQTYRDFKLIYRWDGDGGTPEYLAETQFECRNVSGSSHLGVAGSYFKLIEEALAADYYMLADQDDVWHKNKIEMTLAAMRNAEEKWGRNTPILVHCDLRVVDEQLNPVAESLMEYQSLDPLHCSLKDLIIQNNVTGCTVMINKALRDILKFSNDAVCHDWYIALTAAAFGKIVFVDKPLVDYRQHSSNVYGAVPRKNLFQKLFKRQELHRRLELTQKQAAVFLEQHRSQLKKDQIEILEAWSSNLSEKSYCKRLTKTIKYGFRKNDWLRTLGMWWAL